MCIQEGGKLAATPIEWGVGGHPNLLYSSQYDDDQVLRARVIYRGTMLRTNMHADGCVLVYRVWIRKGENIVGDEDHRD